jgi:transmembrane sensor
MSRFDEEQVMRDLAAMGDVARYRALLGKPTLRERLYPRRFALGASFIAVVSAASWFSWQHVAPSESIETAIAEVREVALPDGSRVTLGARSRLVYEFTDVGRSVTLRGGDALFSVTADAARPFTVSSGAMRIAVLGTQFEIRARDSEVSVAVLEGLVQVSRARSPLAVVMRSAPEWRLLHKGEMLVLPAANATPQPQLTNSTAIGAWRDGRLIYDGVPLRDVIEDANRYFRSGVEIADPKLADIRVTAAFRASQVEDMVDTLQAGLPLDIERRADGRLILHARPASR